LAFAINPTNNGDPMEMGEQMAIEYTDQLGIIVQLLDEPPNNINSPENVLAKGEKAFQKALKVFPDETLPHAHALFAKLCVKINRYEKSLELFDEAIRRASLPLEEHKSSSSKDDDDDDDDGDDSIKQIPQEVAEAESLVKQLILERNRAHFSFLQMSIDKWDSANNALHGGGIPPESSPLDPLGVVEQQLNVFPNPHPQSLFDKATFMVMLLDSPVEDEDEGVNRTAKAWEAYEVYKNAQTWAFGAYTHGKKRNLAGGKPCSGKDSGFGTAVGGAWKKYALESVAFHSAETSDDSNSFTGLVTLQNVIVSGKDAVISGYGDNCQVFVPHRYVNLADNLPMVTSWESSVHELTMGDNPNWMTYIPHNDYKAYGGKIGKDANGNDVLKIPDPKPRSASRGFDSAVLLTGYASDNYYHFVAEVLPSLVMMKDHIEEVLSGSSESKSHTKDVLILPSLQHEFVEGFLRLMLPNAFPNGAPSNHIVQWGLPKRGSFNTTSTFLTPHPITYVRRLHAAIWDQPKEAPPPVSGAAHCLTPSSLLTEMRQAVWNAVDEVRGSDSIANSELRVVFCPRSSSATRSLKEEEELLTSLREKVSELGGELIVFEKASKHDNSTSLSSNKSPLEFVLDSVELFRSANVVVGVHGKSRVYCFFRYVLMANGAHFNSICS
jgi:hypothetical protein